jgi:hypothetical protein
LGGDYGFAWRVVDRTRAGGRALTHAGSDAMNFATAAVVMTSQSGVETFNACGTAASALILHFTQEIGGKPRAFQQNKSSSTNFRESI